MGNYVRVDLGIQSVRNRMGSAAGGAFFIRHDHFVSISNDSNALRTTSGFIVCLLFVENLCVQDRHELFTGNCFVFIKIFYQFVQFAPVLLKNFHGFLMLCLDKRHHLGSPPDRPEKRLCQDIGSSQPSARPYRNLFSYHSG